MQETYSQETAIAFGLLAAVLVLYLIIIAIGIVNYILTSLSLYRIADRRQIVNPWLAWLPFACNWIVGSIADDYDERNGIKRKWRVALLTLSLLAVAGFIAAYAVMFIILFSMALNSDSAEFTSGEALVIIIPFYIFFFAAIIAAVALGFCQAICIYKIFESTVPEKSLKYMLLYLMVPLAGGICLFKCRDKGYSKPNMFYGMYPPAPMPYSAAPWGEVNIGQGNYNDTSSEASSQKPAEPENEQQ